MERFIKHRLVRLSKIEAAIWLWFVDGDIVSVQILAAASHRLLRDLAILWGTRPWPLTDRYLPGKRPLRGRRTEEAARYFREAKEEETLEVSAQWTELHLFDVPAAR